MITIKSTWKASGIRRSVGQVASPLDGECAEFDGQLADIPVKVEAMKAQWGPCGGLPHDEYRAQGQWHYAIADGRPEIVWAE